MIWPWNTIWTNKPLLYSHLHKVGCFLIVLPAEWNNLTHRNVVPVGEWADDMRNLATLDWLKVRVNICHTINFLSVVFSTVGIFDLRKHRDTLGPDKECEYVLTAIPAFMIIFSANLPLGRVRQKFFEAKVPLNYQLRTRFTASYYFIIFIDTLWLH